MIALSIIVGYILCIIGFCLWDSLIGMPIKWERDIDYGPTLWLGAIFWWISTPIALVIAFSNFLDAAKERREDREKEERRKKEKEEEVARKLRVAAEKEYEASMAQVEAEMRGYSEGTSKNKA